jgi:signal transduction histidine kinase
MSVFPHTPPGRSAQIAVVALTLAVFGAAVAFVTVQLRSGLRRQALSSKAETLSAVASLQLAIDAKEFADLSDVNLPEPPGALLDAVLRTSRYRGVMAIRVFDATRTFTGGLPLGISDEGPGADWSERPFARLQPREKLQALLAGPDEQGSTPQGELVEAWVPVRRTDGARLAGVAQFWIAGEDLAVEFAALDRRLITQAVVAWGAGAAIIVLAFGWAFSRLVAANRTLARQTEDLQRANRELVLAAKTSALGTVMAHLIHEIKNPLAGLEIFVAGQGEPGTRDESARELIAAQELTKRLRTMVNDVVGVLRDEQHGAHFDLSCAEVAELAMGRVRPVATAAGVRLIAEIATEKSLEGRRANLAGLVLRNLLQNAVEASPPAGIVRTIGRDTGNGGVEFLVEDRGQGLSEVVRARLFQPTTSTKAGGSGLGLALSQQLAQQVNGRIELVRSSEEGTCFRLVLEPEV